MKRKLSVSLMRVKLLTFQAYVEYYNPNGSHAHFFLIHMYLGPANSHDGELLFCGLSYYNLFVIFAQKHRFVFHQGYSEMFFYEWLILWSIYSHTDKFLVVSQKYYK